MYGKYSNSYFLVLYDTNWSQAAETSHSKLIMFGTSSKIKIFTVDVRYFCTRTSNLHYIYIVPKVASLPSNEGCSAYNGSNNNSQHGNQLSTTRPHPIFVPLRCNILHVSWCGCQCARLSQVSDTRAEAHTKRASDVCLVGASGRLLSAWGRQSPSSPNNSVQYSRVEC